MLPWEIGEAGQTSEGLKSAGHCWTRLPRSPPDTLLAKGRETSLAMVTAEYLATEVVHVRTTNEKPALLISKMKASGYCCLYTVAYSGSGRASTLGNMFAFFFWAGNIFLCSGEEGQQTHSPHRRAKALATKLELLLAVCECLGIFYVQ